MPEGATRPSEKRAGRVLLVEDDSQILNAYSRILRSAGFDVTPVSDGGRVRQALEQPVDVVMCDIGLPGMNGIDVLRVVHEVDADLPVVLMTAAGDLSTAVQAMEFGALRYLLKPIAPALLGSTAADAVRLRQVAQIRRQACELYGKHTDERLTLGASFDSALATLHMAYQPIVRWSSREVLAHEALLRTEEPSLRRPDLWISAAEKLDRVLELGRSIRKSVARTIEGENPPCVFVNLHARDLEDDELYSPDSPLSRVAAKVVLEITERASLKDLKDARSRLATLRKLGFRLAIDDLGAGYAGLTSFAQLCPEIVKLDMSLIRNAHVEPTKLKLIQSMAELCAELGILVVCEGVESALERDALVAAGCDIFQGYLFAKPGPAFVAPTF